MVDITHHLGVTLGRTGAGHKYMATLMAKGEQTLAAIDKCFRNKT